MWLIARVPASAVQWIQTLSKANIKLDLGQVTRSYITSTRYCDVPTSKVVLNGRCNKVAIGEGAQDAVVNKSQCYLARTVPFCCLQSSWDIS